LPYSLKPVVKEPVDTDCDRLKIEEYIALERSTMNDQRSTFQTAIAIVEALRVEEQTMLIEIINNRLKQQRRVELIAEVEIAEKEYAEGNIINLIWAIDPQDLL
jgi:hypothetical protein